MTSYKSKVVWKGEHWGHLYCSNGTDMPFSAPAALHGHPNVMTPEDAFVGALNMCVQMMFLWAAERFKVNLVSYECEAEGFVREFIDQTSAFERVILRPRIVARGSDARRVEQALKSAQKYSLVAQSIRSEVRVEPEIAIQKG
ncbi:MAG: OsmC family protein [Chloroflexi bacterium]|nr:OsmC family protein [Chloroflexota bacterium]